MTRRDFDHMLLLSQKAKRAFVELSDLPYADQYELCGVDEDGIHFSYDVYCRGYCETEYRTLTREALEDMVRLRPSALAEQARPSALAEEALL